MPPAEVEPEISSNERPHTLALDRSATGIDNYTFTDHKHCAFII
jgi:hypothetical protein